ncbi:hypothetical protein [Actinotalea solisilvae]|uniref:hypothetical protein n=1 Tax=Actinotalea solisilvae TaxID=2072922 RepID=UPI0018F223F3|nr:hypothetical protein [Actinotalea solisilvae]
MGEGTWDDEVAGDADEGGAAPGPPTAEPAARYRAAVHQLFDSEDVVRSALRDRLVDATSQSLQLRQEAATAFSGFYPSRVSAADREALTYLAPGDDLIGLLTQQIDDTLQERRDAPSAGRLRLHLTPRLRALLDTTDADDERAGRIALDAILEIVRGAEPLPPADPVAVSRAAARADELIAAITDGAPQPAAPPRDDGAGRPAGPPGPPGPPVNGFAEVAAKLEELLAAIRTPETAPAFEVPSRPDQGSVREGVSTFELRSGPADVTSYHDFTHLRIAFQGVWTEIFDGQLEAVGRQLYEEAVKLRTFAGLDSQAQSIDTLDDLKRLMEEVRDLAQITVDATPSEVRPPTTTSTPVSQTTSAVDVAKEVLLGGPTGDPLVDAILNPGGAIIEAIGNLFAGKQQLTWDSFPGPLPVGGDVITLRFEPEAVEPGTVEFVIENGPQAWWWKGLEFREFDTRGNVVSTFRISNDPRDTGVWQADSYNRLPLYTPQLQNGVIEFQKAAPGLGFGVHTGYYLLAGLPDRMPDRMRAIFRWEKDS